MNQETNTNPISLEELKYTFKVAFKEEGSSYSRKLDGLLAGVAKGCDLVKSDQNSTSIESLVKNF